MRRTTCCCSTKVCRPLVHLGASITLGRTEPTRFARHGREQFRLFDVVEVEFLFLTLLFEGLELLLELTNLLLKLSIIFLLNDELLD